MLGLKQLIFISTDVGQDFFLITDMFLLVSWLFMAKFYFFFPSAREEECGVREYKHDSKCDIDSGSKTSNGLHFKNSFMILLSPFSQRVYCV